MKIYNPIFSLFVLSILISCSSNDHLNSIENNQCFTTNISVSEEDNIISNHATNPILWKGKYNESFVKLSFTTSIGDNGETETQTFILNKDNNCLKKQSAYKFYNGKKVDISAVTEMTITEFYVKEWDIDKTLSGLLVYTDPHDKKSYSRKFFVHFSAIDYEQEASNFLFFKDCLLGKLPIDIDMNADGIIDFKLTYELLNDIGNTPKYNQYTLQLNSTFEEKNKILSIKKNEGPHFIVFEPPFSSLNKTSYSTEVKSSLDIFYEFATPYESFNYFLDNNLTYSNILKNDLKDYFIVSLSIDGEIYYGWIAFYMNTASCNVGVTALHLNTVANEHVYVN
ncbi:MAG: hypothetical protein ABF311_00835 [Polaribacter sp.]